MLAVGEADEQLIAELTRHEGVLCYATHCIERGDSAGEYANLVLFDSEAAKMHWASSQYHAARPRSCRRFTTGTSACTAACCPVACSPSTRRC